MGTSLAELIRTCDELIRAGQVAAAASRLRALNLAQVGREERLPLARICRRAGQISSGIKLLSPVVRGDRGLEVQPTPAEICEYAALLTRIGLVTEALTLLSAVDSGQAPEAELFTSYCQIMRWDYLAAIPHLKRFIAGAGDPYQRQIARVNLAAALVATRQWPEGEALLNELIAELEAKGFSRLMGNALELRSQVFLDRGDFEVCKRDLAAAGAIFKANGSYDQLLVRKWLAYIEASRSRSIAPLTAFRMEALSRQHWESVRDSDLLALKIRFDQNRFDSLFFGSPFAAYRERARTETGGSPSAYYDFGGANAAFFDLLTGEIHGRKAEPPTAKVRQLLRLLLDDFYSPSRVAPLFAGLYPREYYDPHSSPLRVRQLMNRLRRWIAGHSLPLAVVTVKNSFRFVAKGAFSVRIPLAPLQAGEHLTEAERIKSRFLPGHPFSVGEACAAAGLSHSSFHRLALKMIERGELERQGVGKATRYLLVPRARVA